MKCKLGITTASDILYWVRWADFLKCVDETDLACRESKIVKDYYLSDWFYKTDEQTVLFNPPAFYLKNGVAKFINGRHRTILLSRYLAIFPMALTSIDSQSQSVLESVVESEMTEEEFFELPDLPIKEKIVV